VVCLRNLAFPFPSFEFPGFAFPVFLVFLVVDSVSRKVGEDVGHKVPGFVPPVATNEIANTRIENLDEIMVVLVAVEMA
jgi:hypothetical protein